MHCIASSPSDQSINPRPNVKRTVTQNPTPHINKTNAQTGHFKLLVILAAGIFLFHEDANWVRLLGMGCAFAGIVTYTTLKQNMASGWEKPKLTPDGGPLPTMSKQGLLEAVASPKGAL